MNWGQGFGTGYSRDLGVLTRLGLVAFLDGCVESVKFSAESFGAKPDPGPMKIL